MAQLIKELRHLLATMLLAGFGGAVVIPAIADVTTDSLCPGRHDQCPLAFYLTGFQDAIIGFGAMILTPWIGGLSDKYGRKNLLTVPILLSAFPPAILAFKRTTELFYAYYVIRTLTAVLSGGSLLSLALAYAADKVSSEKRIAAFGIVTGVFSASFLCANLAARFLSIAAIFQVSTCVALGATLYMRIFLEETVLDDMDLSISQPILKIGEDEAESGGGDRVPELPLKSFKTVPSLKEIVSLLRRSPTFTRMIMICFFNNMALGWTQASLLFYFKSRFHTNKDQFSILLILVGAFGAISQSIVTSSLSAVMGDKNLLSLALFATLIQMLILSIAWSFWIMYVSSSLFLLTWCAIPTASSIVSRQVEPHEQGKAQGCIFGSQSFAYAISPLIFNPLAALFLSENPPFNFPGFTILILAFFTLVAFVLSLTIKEDPSISSEEHH